MKSVHAGLAAAAFAFALSGCAASPESIKPISVNTAQYSYLSCAQLASYKVTLKNAYNVAADSEDTARTMDAVTNIVVGFPVGSMTHESVPYQIADLKGRIAAVEKLQAQGNCTPQQQASSN